MRRGVCYYPEQWPTRVGRGRPPRWRPRPGLVRIGEFAWSRYEPARGRFAWGWLDEAIERWPTPASGWCSAPRPPRRRCGCCRTARDPLGRTRRPPPRLRQPPAHLPHLARLPRGVRASSTVLAERYGGHPAVVAWQVDNEPGNHDSARCWCDACQRPSAPGSPDADGSIGALNAAWGNAFWSMTTRTSTRSAARPDPDRHNPSLSSRTGGSLAPGTPRVWPPSATS
jgi:beta-galactosidase